MRASVTASLIVGSSVLMIATRLESTSDYGPKRERSRGCNDEFKAHEGRWGSGVGKGFCSNEFSGLKCGLATAISLTGPVRCAGMATIKVEYAPEAESAIWVCDVYTSAGHRLPSG